MTFFLKVLNFIFRGGDLMKSYTLTISLSDYSGEKMSFKYNTPKCKLSELLPIFSHVENFLKQNNFSPKFSYHKKNNSCNENQTTLLF